MASCSDDIIGFGNDNAAGNGSVDIGLVNDGVGGGVGDGSVGVTTWFHAGASGKVPTATVSSSSPPRGYCTQTLYCRPRDHRNVSFGLCVTMT